MQGVKKYKIGFTSVIGDMFHAGHIAMIQECKNWCEKLIVCVVASTDGRKAEPVQSLFERYMQVYHTKGVDAAFPVADEKDLELAIRMIGPEVRFVGEDYVGKDFTGKAFCESEGVDIIYNRRKHGLSSTEIKDRILRAASK